MAVIDWADCALIEVIPGKVSGAPLFKGTRLPVEAVLGNYDAFRVEGLSQEDAILATLDCYPQISVETVHALMRYRAEHELQTQLAMVS